MKRCLCFLALFFLGGLYIFAQSREDIKIYIPPVLASVDQAAYFHENFAMETAGAGYTMTDSQSEADYSLKLEVKPNMIIYDDGYEELAPPEEPQYVLNIHLVRTEDDVEIVAFSFPFDEVDEMYDYNLYLLYEAMANVPFTKEFEVEDDDRWRNKWLYIRMSLDYPVTFYRLISPTFLTYNRDKYPGDPIPRPLDNRISPWLAATVGVEFQYLYWMSTEFSFNLSFSDPMSEAFVPSVQVEQKFPIKPSTHFMIEPYLVASFPMNTSPMVSEFPMFGGGGGVQFGVKGGNMGAFFVDVNFIYFLGQVGLKQEDDRYVDTRIYYNRFTLGLGIGYKLGFFDRPKRVPRQPSEQNN